MMETWKRIEDFPDYAVSDRGRVKRLTSRTCAKAGTILKQCLGGGRKDGARYLSVDLCRDGKRRTSAVHILVAEAFHGRRPVGLVPNHRDTNRRNNAADNLEWVTQSRNVKHAYEMGRRDCRGEGNGQSALTAADVMELRRLAGTRIRFGFYTEQARRLGSSPTTVRCAVIGKTWSHLPGATRPEVYWI